jgi:hypothetical protein
MGFRGAMKAESNYKTAARYTRSCKTSSQLARREENNRRLYENGCLSVNEYARLCKVEMAVNANFSTKAGNR